MRSTQGALIIASTLHIRLGFSGLWRNVVRLVLAIIFPGAKLYLFPAKCNIVYFMHYF